MAARPDEAQLETWRSFVHASVRLTEVLGEELEREQNLPLSWYDVLLNLHEAGGSMRMQDLAHAVLLSRSGLTRLIDRMAADGLVCREAFAADRRGMLAVLTPAGVDRLRAAAPVHLRGIATHFTAALEGDEADAIRRACDRVLAGLAEACADEDAGDGGDGSGDGCPE